ncbi:MAG: hypothetical protein R2706_01875 [Acidimicrobiales bacterium]
MVERQEIIEGSRTAGPGEIISEARPKLAAFSDRSRTCDQKLASFEIVLERTARTISQGREKLLGAAGPDPLAEIDPVAAEHTESAWADFDVEVD